MPHFTRVHVYRYPPLWSLLDTDWRVLSTPAWHQRLARRALPLFAALDWCWPWWLPRAVWLAPPVLGGETVYRFEWRPSVLKVAALQRRAEEVEVYGEPDEPAA